YTTLFRSELRGGNRARGQFETFLVAGAESLRSAEPGRLSAGHEDEDLELVRILDESPVLELVVGMRYRQIHVRILRNGVEGVVGSVGDRATAQADDERGAADEPHPARRTKAGGTWSLTHQYSVSREP